MRRFAELVKKFKRELKVYRAVLSDPRTPFMGRILLGAALAYLLMPFDIIPDWIPILGQLDDVIIVPALVIVALRLIPRELIDEHRARIEQDAAPTP